MAGKKDNISVSPNGTILLQSKVSIMSTNAVTGGLNNPASKKHSGTKDIDEIGLQKWATWGENDDFPKKLMETIGEIGVLGSGLDINASMHYGNGIIWGRDVYENNKKVFVPAACEAWEKLKRNVDIELVQSEIVESLEIFYISFVEVILNNGLDEVVSARCLDTVYCRFERRTGKELPKNIYYSSGFGEEAAPDYDTIPIFDPTNPTKYKKFAFPMVYRTFGNFYYPEPIYYSCIRNGYADVAKSVPKFLKSLFKNQMSIKYIIRVPFELMKRKYINWDTPEGCETTEQVMKWQLTKMQELQEEVNKHLVNEENAYKGLFTFTDGALEGKGIEVEPIKNYMDSAKELPTAAAANSEILFALQVDPSLIGLGIPGGKSLSGSGSDKRESRQIKQASLKRERLVSLRFPNLIAMLSKVDQKLYPTYLDTDTSQTMDENPTGKQTVVQS